MVNATCVLCMILMLPKIFYVPFIPRYFFILLLYFSSIFFLLESFKSVIKCSFILTFFPFFFWLSIEYCFVKWKLTRGISLRLFVGCVNTHYYICKLYVINRHTSTLYEILCIIHSTNHIPSCFIVGKFYNFKVLQTTKLFSLFSSFR